MCFNSGYTIEDWRILALTCWWKMSIFQKQWFKKLSHVITQLQSTCLLYEVIRSWCLLYSPISRFIINMLLHQSHQVKFLHFFIFSDKYSDFNCLNHNLPLVAEFWPATAACWRRCPCTLPGRGCRSHGSPDTNRLVSAHWTLLPAPGPWGNHRQRGEKPMKGLVTTIKNRWVELTVHPLLSNSNRTTSNVPYYNTDL